MNLFNRFFVHASGRKSIFVPASNKFGSARTGNNGTMLYAFVKATMYRYLKTNVHEMTGF